MKRTGYLGIPLLLVFALLLSALPSLGQAPAGQTPALQFKTRPEYDAYIAFFNEKDPAKKATLGEKFITDFKESDYLPTSHMLIVGAYTNAKNWPKVMDAADRAVAIPNADNKLKEFSFESAMIAAQNANNVDKVISYGEKALTVNANNLNAMITVSAVIPAKLPEDAAGKKTALDKAEDLAKKALAGIEGMLAKADAPTKAQLVPVQGTLHATLGLVAYNRPDYNKSIQEYEEAVKITPKDDVAHFYMGLDYQALAAQASREYAAAVKAENDAKAARADQPTIDELSAKSAGLGEDTRKFRDKALDEFGLATAIGGPVAVQAKDALTKLWMSKNNDSTEGLDAFIAQKKQQLG